MAVHPHDAELIAELDELRAQERQEELDRQVKLSSKTAPSYAPDEPRASDAVRELGVTADHIAHERYKEAAVAAALDLELERRLTPEEFVALARKIV